MNKKVILGLTVGVMCVAVGVGAYALGRGSKNSDKVSPTPTPVVERVAETQLTGKEKSLALLEERQSEAYSSDSYAPADNGEWSPFGVYYGVYQDNPIIFVFSSSTNPETNDRTWDMTMVHYMNIADFSQYTWDADTIPFNDVRQPLELLEVFDDARETDGGVTGIAIDDRYIYYSYGFVVYPDVEMISSYYAYEGVNKVDIITGMQTEVIPHREVDTTISDIGAHKGITLVENGYMVLQDIPCISACGGPLGVKWDSEIYNLDTMQSIQVEGAKVTMVNAGIGMFLYQEYLPYQITCDDTEEHCLYEGETEYELGGPVLEGVLP